MPVTQCHRVVFTSFVVLVATSAASAQTNKQREYGADDPAATWKEEDSIDNRWNETDIGPFIASVLPTPGGTVAKGLSIKVGDTDHDTVCYDLETMAMKAAWSGGFVKFNPRRYGIVSAPTIDGTVRFHDSRPGWAESTVKYRGLYHHGSRVTLAFRVDGIDVLETPWRHKINSQTVFTRTLDVAAHEKPLTVSVCEGLGRPLMAFVTADGDVGRQFKHGERESIVWIEKSPDTGAIHLNSDSQHVSVVLPPADNASRFTVSVAPECNASQTIELIEPLADYRTIVRLVQPCAQVWTKRLTTVGVVGATDEAPYVIDTITIPFDNPYKALMFMSGHDFFSNGDMAASTLHGDVWLIRGVDERLEKITWKRYATGLHQPLGLRIVDDTLYVLGKDQITRLHDRNGDGEADFYENFNNDGATSKGGHDYASCLETDPEGNFYYIRAHEGVCRVSSDGSRHESIATGFRNPIGLGVGPDGTVTAAPQEGNWTPSSLIAEVKEGGYYGYGGPKVTPGRPLGYDPPLCWIPRENDSSSGGQVWVTSDRWGPLAGQMLHLSYGRCQMCLVLREHAGGVAQGGTIKFPLFFESGVMRGRFSPHDGQLYLSGLRGWQCAATKDGCIQRVRYTGKPVDMPLGLHVRPDGLEIRFSRSLDPLAAADPDNYFVEQWNYHYTGNYGSKDYKVSDPKRTGRDEVEVFDARMLDDRTVFLELDDVQPVMQMGISYAIKAAGGAEIRQTIYNTINAVPSESKDER